MSKLQWYFQERGKAVEEALQATLPLSLDTEGTPLADAMRYTALAGGKRLRPILTLLSTETVGGSYRDAIPAGIAIELIHTYSLVHDDLPAMDDDEFRRGKPTNHKVYGEAQAILAGDALLTLAFEVLGKQIGYWQEDRARQVITEIAIAAGYAGMVGGQAKDLVSEGKRLSLEQLKDIHKKKTGALIRASVRSGAIIGGAKEEELNALTKFADNFGLAFQIVDDLLDLTGDEQVLGKGVGSDLRKAKATYPGILGIEEARNMAFELIKEAKEGIRIFADIEILEELADYVLERDR